MREHPKDLGVILAGANAAEMAKRFLHPELEGQHGGPTVLPQIMATAIPEAIHWVTQEEKEQFAAEARTRAIAAEEKARASVERSQRFMQRVGAVVLRTFQAYLWINLVFGIYQVVYWIEAAAKFTGTGTAFDICCAELFRCLVNSFVTTVTLIVVWKRHQKALDAAILLLLLRVAMALVLAVYYESVRRLPVGYVVTWQISAVMAAFWIPCLSWLRQHWRYLSEIKISSSFVGTDAALGRIHKTATFHMSWQLVTLLCVAMFCGTAFAIAWVCFRPR